MFETDKWTVAYIEQIHDQDTIGSWSTWFVIHLVTSEAEQEQGIQIAEVTVSDQWFFQSKYMTSDPVHHTYQYNDGSTKDSVRPIIRPTK